MGELNIINEMRQARAQACRDMQPQKAWIMSYDGFDKLRSAAEYYTVCSNSGFSAQPAFEGLPIELDVKAECDFRLSAVTCEEIKKAESLELMLVMMRDEYLRKIRPIMHDLAELKRFM